MKMISILALTTFLSCSCIYVPKNPLTRCVYAYQFKKFRCHLYDIEKMERVSESWDVPFDTQEKMIAFPLDDWEELYKMGVSVREYRNDYNQSPIEH